MEAAWLAMMPHSIQVEPYASKDKYNAVTYGTAFTCRARIEQKARQIRDARGEERVSMTLIYAATITEITPRDRVTLPSGFTPNQPPILRVDRVSDEVGLHHTEIYC